jgi:Metallo-peptidase family M12
MMVLRSALAVCFVVLQCSQAVQSRTLRVEKGLILPINSTFPALDHTGNSVMAVDLSGLLNITDFKKIRTMILQLEPGGPIWEISKEKGTTINYFVGITSNRGAMASFYRHQGQITGVIHDSHEGLWYELKPNIQGHVVVSLVSDTEVGSSTRPAFEAPKLTSLLPQSRELVGNMEPLQPLESTTSALSARSLLHHFLPSGWFRDFQDTTMVDILVVWTKDAECAKSLLPAKCTVSRITRRNMVLAVHFFIQETNSIFRNSGLQLKLGLAGGQRVEYQETTFQQALIDLRERLVPGVQDRREELKADVVMMLMDRTYDYPETGVAYNNYDHVDADYMYSVVAVQYTSVWYLPAHEIGHNFGCSHDRGTADMCDDIQKSSYGYRDPQGLFRTIMSYPCQARQCDVVHGADVRNKLDCPIIPYFSNDRPNGRFFGASLGGQANNCAGQIERVQHMVANLY